jgi:hypothetical protein
VESELTINSLAAVQPLAIRNYDRELARVWM